MIVDVGKTRWTIPHCTLVYSQSEKKYTIEATAYPG